MELKKSDTKKDTSKSKVSASSRWKRLSLTWSRLTSTISTMKTSRSGDDKQPLTSSRPKLPELKAETTAETKKFEFVQVIGEDHNFMVSDKERLAEFHGKVSISFHFPLLNIKKNCVIFL